MINSVHDFETMVHLRLEKSWFRIINKKGTLEFFRMSLTRTVISTKPAQNVHVVLSHFGNGYYLSLSKSNLVAHFEVHQNVSHFCLKKDKT